MADELLERVRATGLLAAGADVVVLLSGGRDSVCLLDVAVELGCSARALHVNYGLRAEADDDEAHCRALCERLGVALAVHRATRPEDAPGNLQAWARDVRYAAAAEMAGGDLVAVGPHGLRPGRDGALPAGRVARAPRPARYAGRARATWCARCSRLRARRPAPGVAPAAWPGATTRPTPPTSSRAGACATGCWRRWRRSTRARRPTSCAPPSCCARRPRCSTSSSTRRWPGATASRCCTSPTLPPALARLIVRRLAEAATGGLCARAPARLDDILAFGDDGALDVGDGARAVVSSGVLHFETTPPLRSP